MMDDLWDESIKIKKRSLVKQSAAIEIDDLKNTANFPNSVMNNYQI